MTSSMSMLLRQGPTAGIEVTVEYEMCPADPECGFPDDYPEWDGVTTEDGRWFAAESLPDVVQLDVSRRIVEHSESRSMPNDG